MHCEYFFVDNSCNWQAIKAVGERLPQLDVVSPLAFIIKAIYPVDGGTLMVSTENKKVLWILYLVCKQQANCFQRLLASVHVVPEKEIVGLGGESSILEKAEKIVILPVNIPANLRMIHRVSCS